MSAIVLIALSEGDFSPFLSNPESRYPIALLNSEKSSFIRFLRSFEISNKADTSDLILDVIEFTSPSPAESTFTYFSKSSDLDCTCVIVSTNAGSELFLAV